MAEDYPVNIVFDAIDQVSKPMRRINDRIERMTGPVRKLNNRMHALGREGGMQRLTNSARNLRRGLGNVIGATGQVAARVGALGGVAAFGLHRMFTSFGNTAERVKNLSTELGVGTDWLQEWQFAAERTGVPQDRLNDSLSEFNGRLGELKSEGSGPLAEALKKANPALLEQLKHTENLEQAFSIYMHALENTKDEQKRAALASAGFSDEGRVLVNIAERGSREIAKLRGEAHEYGRVLDSDALKSGKSFLKVQRNLNSAFAGLAVALSTSLLPAVNELFGKLTNWIVDNRAQVKEWADNFAAALPGVLRKIGDAAGKLFDQIQELMPLISWMFDTFGTAETILGGAAIVIGGPLIGAFAALVPVAWSLGSALLATPIGWFIGGVALIAAGIWGLKKGIDWLEERFPNAFEVVQDAFGVLVDALTAPFDLIFGRFDKFAEKVRRIGDTIEKYIPDWFKDWISGDSDAELRVNADGSVAAGASGGRFSGARAAAQASSRTERSEKRVEVDFKNLPQGARVTEDGDADDVPVNVGRSMSRGM